MKKLFIILLAIFIASFFIGCDKDSFFNLTITIEGSGSGTITADGSPVTSGSAIKILKDKSVELVVTPSSGSIFNGWTGTDSGDVTGTGPYTIVMDSDKALTATFVGESSITLSATPTELFEDSSNMGYLAYPNTIYVEVIGSTFDSDIWDGDLTANGLPDGFTLANVVYINEHLIRFSLWGGASNHSAANSTSFTVTVNKDAVGAETNITTNPITITFFDDPTYFISTTIYPEEAVTAGCTITYSPDTYPYFNSGETVTMTVNPASGWAFGTWPGNSFYNVTKTGPNTYTIQMWGSNYLDAFFVKTVDGDTFAEDFEGTTSGDWNDLTSGNDWALIENTFKTSMPILQNTLVHGGSQAVRFGNNIAAQLSDATYESFFGIQLENMTTEKALTLWYYHDTPAEYGQQFIIRVNGEDVVTIEQNIAAWQQVQTYLPAGNNTVIFISKNNSWDNSTTDNKNIWIDDITLETPTSCIGEVNYYGISLPDDTGTTVNIGEVENNVQFPFTVTNTGTATLNISGVNIAGSTEITCESTFPITIPRGESADIMFKATPIGGPYTATVTINSNEPNTPYEFVFSCSVPFFYENFEDGGSLPAGWTIETITGDANWSIYEWMPHLGNYTVMYDGYKDEGYSTRFYTPAIDCTSLTNPVLSFWMRNPTYITSGYNDDLQVYYKVGAAGSWTLLQSYTTDNENYTRKTINLVNTNTTEYYISFVGVSHYGAGIWIDDVAITGQ